LGRLVDEAALEARAAGQFFDRRVDPLDGDLLADLAPSALRGDRFGFVENLGRVEGRAPDIERGQCCEGSHVQASATGPTRPAPGS
jgi:hypothetical protein